MIKAIINELNRFDISPSNLSYYYEDTNSFKLPNLSSDLRHQVGRPGAMQSGIVT